MYDKHMFVCTNQKEEGKRSCGAAGSAEICERLKASAKMHPALARRAIRINKSGCLGLCEEGPTIVVYPQARWYVGVSVSDVPELLAQEVLQDEPVTRLLRKKTDAKTP